jgi:hypothetical protein
MSRTTSLHGSRSKNNLNLLAETLRLGELSNPRTEVSVGSFYIDILADEGNTVVIENQFGSTDHTHLGQIMTYVGGQEGKATTVVWIAESFRDEHRAAIDWLNASTLPEFDFFAVEVEVFKIGDSTAAPHFNVVAYPNNWSRRVTGATRSNEQFGDREREYVAFWSGFQSLLKERNVPFRVESLAPPSGYYWIFGIGRAGFRLLARAGMRDDLLGVELRINLRTYSKSAYDKLLDQKDAIETEIGEKLKWLRLEGQIRSKIELTTAEFKLTDRAKWPEAHSWLAARLMKFREAFRPRVLDMQLTDATPEPNPD